MAKSNSDIHKNNWFFLFRRSNGKLYVILFVLFYLFNFSLGAERIDVYKNYAYAYGSLLAFFYFIRVISLGKIIIDKKFLYFFIAIQYFTVVFGLFNGTLLPPFVNAGHQVMFLVIFGGVFILYDFDRISFTRFFCNQIILITTLSLVFAFYGFMFGSFSFGPFFYLAQERFAFSFDGWYDGKNYLGAALAIGAIVLLFKLLNSILFTLSFHQRIWLFLLFILHIVGIILSGSRGSYVSFVIGLLVLLIFQQKLVSFRIKHIIYGFIFISLLFYAVFSIFVKLDFDWAMVESYFIRYEQLERYQQGGERVGLWSTAFRFIKEANILEFLFGHGIGYYKEKVGHAAHSGYIELFIGRGMIVFSLFLYLLYYSFKRSIKINNQLNIGTLTMSLLSLIVAKNIVNAEIPTNNFPGIVFVFILVLLFFKSRDSANIQQCKL